MPEKVTISHRGARYEIGRGKRFYGIWVTGAPESGPVESGPVDRWPETPDGWAQAWARFMTMEDPSTITSVEQQGFTLPRLRRGPDKDPAADGSGFVVGWVSFALLILGIVLGIAGLFPDYSGASLISQSDQLVPHLLYLAGWMASAGMAAAGLRRAAGAPPSGTAAWGTLRAGALLGTGVSAVTLGLLGSDLAQVISGQAVPGVGLILALAGWAVCTAGAVTGAYVRGIGCDSNQNYEHKQRVGPGRPVRPRREHSGPIALLALGGIGTAAAFAPSWDSYTLQSQAGSQTVTLGNAFTDPGPVIAANLIVMAAIVAVAITASLWRPMRQGAALLAGAIIPLAAQAISALIQVAQPTSPTMFGISPAQAAEAGLAISSGVTAIFWVYCVFVIALAISCAWLLTEPALPAAPNPAPSPWAGPLMPMGEQHAPTTPEPAAEEQAPSGEENPGTEAEDGTRNNA